MKSTKQLTIILIILITILISCGIIFSKNKETAKVFEVIDGDTIRLTNEKTVRLIGINAPEKGQYYFEESKSKLKELVEERKITLEKDVDEKDSFGRLLRYVFIGDKFVNLKLVEEGYAYVLTISPDTKYSDKFIEAENKAKLQEIGIWKKPFFNCIRIEEFHFDANGNDNNNLNDEYITFKNICNFFINLTNWMIKDKTNNTYIFPEFIFSTKFTLYSGSGINLQTKIYWNSKRAIWDNRGDILYLIDDEGDLILKYDY